MTSTVSFSSEEEVLHALPSLLTASDDVIDLERILNGFAWAQLRVYIPHPPQDSSISPPMMEAYIRLQKSIYQTVALAKYGQANILKLSDDDKEKYEISVVVKPGSSDQVVDLKDVLLSLAKDLVGKMTPSEIFWLIALMALLYAGHSAWKLFLQNRREIRLAEVASEERQKTLETFDGLSAQETQRLKHVLDQTANKVTLGKEVIRRAEAANESFLRAAAEGGDAKIRDVDISPMVAKELRTSSRRRASVYTIEKEMRVVDVNTQNELLIVAYLEDPETFDVAKVEFQDAVLAGHSRLSLFNALENRKMALVKMEVKDLEGEITPLRLLKVTVPPDTNKPEN